MSRRVDNAIYNRSMYPYELERYVNLMGAAELAEYDSRIAEADRAAVIWQAESMRKFGVPYAGIINEVVLQTCTDCGQHYGYHMGITCLRAKLGSIGKWKAV